MKRCFSLFGVVLLVLAGGLFSAPSHAQPASSDGPIFNVRDFGAAGDSTTLDTPAIDRAVAAAADAGGGTVYFPAGTYASFSIQLRSHVTLYLGAGATLLAADSGEREGGYDDPAPNKWGDELEYQDFGHSHWRNSLIWGENVEDVAILGPGRIDGKGLWKGLRPPLGPAPDPDPGNTAIALKESRNVTLRDFTIFRGGHFGILASGVNNLTIDNLRIDTNRDGIDIDICRNVHISNVSVNSPNDDAIVLKSSYALGEARPTQNVTITNSTVSGYDLGTMLDGTYQTTTKQAPDRGGPTGRIKFGTESNGGFKNITISNVTFDRTRGLALETVDGGHLEDVTISNITMRNVSNAPLFLRLGRRMRGPEGVPIGKLRRVTISDVIVYDADPRYPAIISGLPEHAIEDVTLNNIHFHYQGGLSMEEAAQQPENLVNPFFVGEETGTDPRDPYDVPERAAAYPEPSMFGILPAYGFYIRHTENIEMHNVEVHFAEDDRRPAFILQDVTGADLFHIDADRAEGVPAFVLRDVTDFRLGQSDAAPDAEIDHADQKEL